MFHVCCCWSTPPFAKTFGLAGITGQESCLHLVQPVAEHSVMVDCVTNATHLPHHCHICTWMAHEYCVLCTCMCYIVVLYLILLGSHATLVRQFCFRGENKITFCAARFLLLTNLFHLHLISCECWMMFS